jgi:hypothetical protein
MWNKLWSTVLRKHELAPVALESPMGSQVGENTRVGSRKTFSVLALCSLLIVEIDNSIVKLTF